MPGCRPPPGTSRFKFPKNQKKQKLWLNSLKIDTNEIGDSRVCALHFAKSDFKPNLSTFLEIPEISSKRKFLLPSAIPSLTVKEPRSPSGTLKKLNHKCIIKDLLEMEEMEMSIMQEETTSSVQTQTDLTMEDIFDLESAKNSLKQAQTKTNQKKMVSNFLVELGYTASVAKSMLKYPEKITRKPKYTQDDICTALTLKSIRNG